MVHLSQMPQSPARSSSVCQTSWYYITPDADQKSTGSTEKGSCQVKGKKPGQTGKQLQMKIKRMRDRSKGYSITRGLPVIKKINPEAQIKDNGLIKWSPLTLDLTILNEK